MTTFVSLFASTVYLLIEALGLLIVARAILGLFFGDDEESGLYGFCVAVTEPFVSPVRSALDKTKVAQSIGIDLSYIVTYIIIILVELLLSLVP